jgi:hypothetical protein
VTPELVLVEGGLYRVDRGDAPEPDRLARDGSLDEAVEAPPPDHAA